MSIDDQRQGATDEKDAAKRKAESRVREERPREDGRREEHRKTEQMKTDAQRKAESAKAEERRIAEGRRLEERKRADRRQEAARKDNERRTQSAKALDQKERDRRQTSRQAEQRREADGVAAEKNKKDALALDIRRRAEAAVAERQQRQKAQQQEEHRRQTDHVRSLHRDEMCGFRDNEDTAIAKHARQIEAIDLREQKALEELGTARESLLGRAVRAVKGEAHYTRKADAIVERCEAERIARHCDLEALKERQFAATQQARLRHAHERKAIFELHRIERRDLLQAHARNRAPEIGLAQRASVRVADRKQQIQEQDNGPSRGLSR